MKILFSGGGTGGSVIPLLCLKKGLQEEDPKTKFFWIGTKDGIEKEMLANDPMEYYPICCGKFRRYLSFQNIIDLFRIKVGFWQALRIIYHLKPDRIVVAGGFVAVPVVWAGWLLGKKIILHQQDVHIGLANRLMAPFASVITIGLDISAKKYPRKKIIYTGNPLRSEIMLGDKSRGLQYLNFNQNYYTVMVIGGGTGASALNDLVEKSLDELSLFCQIVHITGKGKLSERLSLKNSELRYYKNFEFIRKQLADFYATADLVVTRAGINVLNELSALGKKMIIIPIPGSHQELNAMYFNEKAGVPVYNQSDLTPKDFASAIKIELEKGSQSEEKLKSMAKYDAVKKISQIILK